MTPVKWGVVSFVSYNLNFLKFCLFLAVLGLG